MQDTDRIGKIAEVFPLIFFLVAALISLTSMSRMIEEQRVQIGTLKALGYYSKKYIQIQKEIFNDNSWSCRLYFTYNSWFWNERRNKPNDTNAIW